MIPDTTNTIPTAKAVPGDISPDLLELGELFADLTPRERTQAWSYLVSLRQSKPA